MSIAMDGTDQLSNGIPQFREISKDDCGQMRIKNHLEIVQIAAAPDIIKCFIVPEDICGDSNVSVEVLQRSLKAEERRRGSLPPVLYLQLDNCRGSNKNTYLLSYLGWLVERGVFEVIYVSFLPVGHTHNGPDRIASRVANAVRRTDIRSENRLMELIRGSHSPQPEVEFIDCVAGFKKLINPEESQAFTGALVHRLEGLCTLRESTLQENANYMAATSNLHFRFAKTSTGEVCVQNKQTVDVADWSGVEYIWKPDEHGNTASRMDLLPELRTAPSAPIPEERATELLRNLKGLSWRLSPLEYQTLEAKVNYMHQQRPHTALHWADGGYFRCETVEDDDDDDDYEDYDDRDDRDESDNALRLPDRNCLIYLPSERDMLRGQTLAIELRANDFIAYKPFYLDEVPEDARVPIYVGRITHVNPDEEQVQILAYYCASKEPLVNRIGNRVEYKPWTHSNKFQDVHLADIYHKFTIEAAKWSKFPLTVGLKAAIAKNIEARTVDNVVVDLLR
jgi:hypothetical protein